MGRKRRSNNQGSIRQRSDGRWEAILSLPDGNRLSFYGRTEDEAHRKLTASLYQRQGGNAHVSRGDQGRSFGGLVRGCANHGSPSRRGAWPPLARCRPRYGVHPTEPATPTNQPQVRIGRTEDGPQPSCLGSARGGSRPATRTQEQS